MLSGTHRDPPGNLLRPPGASARVTNVELFFDLVYVFAVTQLSALPDRPPHGRGRAAGPAAADHGLAGLGLHHLGDELAGPGADPGPADAARADPGQPGHVGRAAGRVRRAGAGRGRRLRAHADRPGIFAVAGLRGQPLRRNFQRILAWCVVSGSLAVAGGLVAGHARDCSGWRRSPSTCSAAWWASAPRVSAGRDPGLDHRGQSLRRALPGVHPDRAGRVDRGDRGCAVPLRRSPGRRSSRSWPRSSAASGSGGCTFTAARRRARRSSPARPTRGGWAVRRITSSTR